MLTDRQAESLVESLAGIAHDVWARWMRHLFAHCDSVADGHGQFCYQIPSHLAERWQRQMLTAYADLPDEEKASDREIAREYVQAIACKDTARRLADAVGHAPYVAPRVWNTAGPVTVEIRGVRITVELPQEVQDEK